MAYNITNSDGSTLLSLADGQTDSVSASITFVGKNVSRFGEIQNNNFLHLLENFAHVSEPAYKLTGQLWFDTLTNTLKLYNGAVWQPLSVLSYSSTSTAASSVSNLWYDTNNDQLFINSGSGFTLVGPEKAPGFNPTRFISASIKDTEDVSHPVIECLIDDEVIYVVSKDDFVTSSTNLISGIPHVYKGITLKNGTVEGSTDANLVGASRYATYSDTLKNSAGTLYISAAISADASTIVERDAQGGIQANELITDAITTLSIGTVSGTWEILNGLRPTTTGGAYLGTAAKRWSNVYAQNLDVNTALNAATISFTSLRDSDLTSIVKFDNDLNLTADSSTRLPTQYAVKHYVDSKIGTTQEHIDNLPAISINSSPNTLVKRDGSSGIFAARVTSVELKLTASSPVITYIDTSLTANSDARIPTQKAIKQYIDDAVAAEINNRISGDASLQSQINGLQTIPSGTVFFTAGSAIPAGFLAASGQVVSRTTYPALFTALGGESSPYGHTLTTFTLPDLRGEFIRGWDNGRGIDTGRALGSTQTDDFKSHQHYSSWGEAWAGPYGQSPVNGYTGSNKTDNDNYAWLTSAVGGTETRPKNIALQAIIKY